MPKKSALRTGPAPPEALIGNSVIEKKSARAQRLVRRTKVLRKPRAPDVLEHADADDLVEAFAAQFAIVPQLDVRPISNVCGRNAALRFLVLGTAYRNAERLRSHSRGSNH